MTNHTPLLAGLDIGSTTIKAVIFDTTGQPVAQANLSTPTHHPRPGWAYHHPEELWQASVNALRQATNQLANPQQIVSLAVTSIGEAGVPLDHQQQPTYEIIAWFDQRTEPQADWLRLHIGADELFKVAGIALQPIFSLCKLLWLKKHEPTAFSRTTHWLNVADYIAFRLCGEMATDYSLASRMLMMDLHRRQWADDVLSAVGLSTDLLAPLQPSGTVLAPIQSSAAHLTGLPPTTNIVVGGHDQICGALAAGVIESTTVLDSLGTAEGICIPFQQPLLTDPMIGQQGYTQGVHVVPDYYYLIGGLYSSGECFAWLQEIVGHDYETLLSEAAQVPVGSWGSYFLPHLRFANAPNNDPKTRASFIGLSRQVNRGAMVRAVLEGLAYEARYSLEPMMLHLGLSARPQIRAIGGGTRNRLLMQIKANVFRSPLTVIEVAETTALGAAMLSGIGAGVYPTIPAALDQLRLQETIIHPQPEPTELYDMYYNQVYRQFYTTLRHLNQTIHRLQQ